MLLVRYYPRAFGEHFAQIVLGTSHESLPGPLRELPAVASADLQMTDFEIFQRHFSQIERWGDLHIDVRFPV